MWREERRVCIVRREARRQQHSDDRDDDADDRCGRHECVERHADDDNDHRRRNAGTVVDREARNDDRSARCLSARAAKTRDVDRPSKLRRRNVLVRSKEKVIQKT